MPLPLKRLVRPLLNRVLAARADETPPTSARQMAKYMARWRLIDGLSEADARHRMNHHSADVELTRPDLQPPSAAQKPIRLPAQWEAMETIILTWPTLYPPLWALYAEMVKAIVPVCGVTIIVSRPTWASGIRVFLEQQGIKSESFDNIRFLNLPTDDIWVRDYGPFVGLDEYGEQVVINATFDPLTTYPQQNDNAMAMRWAAYHEIPAREVDLHTEGGNYWSDGAGTLIMSDETFLRHEQIGRAEVERRLHEAFEFDKLIVTPHLLQEETGHVDLLMKLADAQTVLVTHADRAAGLNTENLRKTAELFRGERNAQGQAYNVVELPALPRYFNWGAFSIWRSYTNSLTVNGRVLVPIYEEATDEAALFAYEHAMPGYDIMPINCRVGINGGGAVHCMTKEVPRGKR